MKEDFKWTGNFKPYLDKLPTIGTESLDEKVRYLALEMEMHADAPLDQQATQQMARLLATEGSEEVRQMVAHDLSLAQDRNQALEIYAQAFANEKDLSGRGTCTSAWSAIPRPRSARRRPPSSRNACGYWGVETGVVASLSWNVTIRTTDVVCYGNGSGNQNEVKHTFANDYVFRQWHFLKEPTSYDLTCDRCQIGDEGGTGQRHRPPHPHAVRPLRQQQHLVVLELHLQG